MPSPFPGMDPYLEKPGLWPDVHHSLISAYRDLLAAQLRPKYLVQIDERAYITEESDDYPRRSARTSTWSTYRGTTSGLVACFIQSACHSVFLSSRSR